jgi:hypothetical protein
MLNCQRINTDGRMAPRAGYVPLLGSFRVGWLGAVRDVLVNANAHRHNENAEKAATDDEADDAREHHTRFFDLAPGESRHGEDKADGGNEDDRRDLNDQKVIRGLYLDHENDNGNDWEQQRLHRKRLRF